MVDSNSESASRDEHLVETSDVNSPLLDGMFFFRVVSVAYDGKIGHPAQLVLMARSNCLELSGRLLTF
jgi:hypothetical protein